MALSFVVKVKVHICLYFLYKIMATTVHVIRLTTVKLRCASVLGL